MFQLLSGIRDLSSPCFAELRTKKRVPVCESFATAERREVGRAYPNLFQENFGNARLSRSGIACHNRHSCWLFHSCPFSLSSRMGSTILQMRSQPSSTQTRYGRPRLSLPGGCASSAPCALASVRWSAIAYREDAWRAAWQVASCTCARCVSRAGGRRTHQLCGFHWLPRQHDACGDWGHRRHHGGLGCRRSAGNCVANCGSVDSHFTGDNRIVVRAFLPAFLNAATGRTSPFTHSATTWIIE